MESIFSLNNLFTLGMLTLLQAVLGFDNLLYISLESERAPEKDQSRVRKLGIGLAVLIGFGIMVQRKKPPQGPSASNKLADEPAEAVAELAGKSST